MREQHLSEFGAMMYYLLNLMLQVALGLMTGLTQPSNKRSIKVAYM